MLPAVKKYKVEYHTSCLNKHNWSGEKFIFAKSKQDAETNLRQNSKCPMCETQLTTDAFALQVRKISEEAN